MGIFRRIICELVQECPGDTVPVDRADNRMSASVSNGASLADAAAVGGGAMDVNAAYRSSTSSSGDLPQYASVRSNTSSSRDNATYRSSVAGYSDNSEYRQNTDVAPRPYNSVSQRSHESYSVRSSSITADNK